MKRVPSCSREKPLESAILADCLQFLSLLPDCFAWRNNSGAIALQSAGSKRRYVRYGLVGSSDIIGVWRGIFLAVECKRPGNTPTDAQESFMSAIRAKGGVAVWVDSLDALLDRLNEECDSRGWKRVS